MEKSLKIKVYLYKTFDDRHAGKKGRVYRKLAGIATSLEKFEQLAKKRLPPYNLTAFEHEGNFITYQTVVDLFEEQAK
jgi:hypothetical protein